VSINVVVPGLSANTEIIASRAPPECRKAGSFLLNNRLQMRVSGATAKVVAQTKQTKIGLGEQVSVN